MSKYLSFYEIEQLLQSHKNVRYDFTQHPNFDELVGRLSQLPAELVYKVLDGAFFIALDRDEVNEFTVNKLLRVLDKFDQKAIENYQEAFTALESSSMSEELRQVIIDQIFNDLSIQSAKVNLKITDMSTEFLAYADKVSSDFSNITADLRKDLINVIYLNCIKRMKTFWQKVEPENFKGVIDTLTNDLGEENFSEEELIDLSNKCATIFCDSTRDKILGIEEVLKDYKDYCLLSCELQKELNADDIEKLKMYKIGQVFRSTASISKANTRTIAHTAEFLKGKSIGEIFAHRLGEDDKNAQLYKNYSDAKLDLSVSDMVWILTKNPSIFTNSLTSTLGFIDKIKSSMEASYGEKSKDIDYSSLLTRENFLRGIPKNVDDESISKTVELLSCFMSPDKMKSYLQSDMTIFNMDYEQLHSLVLDVFINSKKHGNIEEDLNDILKKKIYEKLTTQKQDRKISKSKDVKTNEPEKSTPTDKLNVNINLAEIGDIAFDFDLAKLQSFLGKYYDEFIKSLRKSNIDKQKLNSVVADATDKIVGRDEDSVNIDIDNLQAQAHSSYSGSYTNQIELLWQLQRNMASATVLMQKLMTSERSDKRTDNIYIATSTYFKLAGEKDGIFKSVDSIPDYYKDTASYLKNKIDTTFETLTEHFGALIKGDEKYLSSYIDKLNKQAEIVYTQIDKLELGSIDENIDVSIEERRKVVLAALEDKKKGYIDAQSNLQLTRNKIESIKQEMKKERESFGNKKIEKEPTDLFGFIYVSNREQELQIEVNNLIGKELEQEGRVQKLLSDIQELEAIIAGFDKKIRNIPLCKGIEKRLSEIKSRILYATIVYDKLQEEKE